MTPMQYTTLFLGNARAILLLSKAHFCPSSYANSMQQLLSHHQCVASSSTVVPNLVPPICAVMRAGSLKTLGIGPLIKPEVLQVLEELPHCTHLSELELRLSLSDEVRHVTFVYSASTEYQLILYTPAHIVRLGGSACPPNKGSYRRDCLTALNAGSWGQSWSCLTYAVRHACCGLDI